MIHCIINILLNQRCLNKNALGIHTVDENSGGIIGNFSDNITPPAFTHCTHFLTYWPMRDRPAPCPKSRSICFLKLRTVFSATHTMPGLKRYPKKSNPRMVFPMNVLSGYGAQNVYVSSLLQNYSVVKTIDKIPFLY